VAAQSLPLQLVSALRAAEACTDWLTCLCCCCCCCCCLLQPLPDLSTGWSWGGSTTINNAEAQIWQYTYKVQVRA